MKRLICIFSFIGLIACEEAFFPSSIYDYQVERLLAGDSTKTWLKVVDSNLCEDSVKLGFNAIDDSLDVFQVKQTRCLWLDTVFLGRTDASDGPNGLTFTDSLVFNTGEIWRISYITSDEVQIVFNSDSSASFVN